MRESFIACTCVPPPHNSVRSYTFMNTDAKLNVQFLKFTSIEWWWCCSLWNNWSKSWTCWYWSVVVAVLASPVHFLCTVRSIHGIRSPMLQKGKLAILEPAEGWAINWGGCRRRVDPLIDYKYAFRYCRSLTLWSNVWLVTLTVVMLLVNLSRL